MYENPFTPEAQIAKKSLLKKEAKSLNLKISDKVGKRIEKVHWHNDYEAKYHIKPEQAEFLIALENQLVGKNDNDEDNRIKRERSRDLIKKMIEEKKLIKLSKEGDILFLKLNRINLGFLPKEIGNLANLEELYCTEDQLDALPEEVGNLIKLRIFDFADNHIQVMPEQIEQLVSLTNLNCSYNDLRLLPNQIGKLKN